MLLLLILACTASEPEHTTTSSDGGASTDGGSSSTDGGSSSTDGGADTGTPSTWTGLAACSNLRLLATDGSRELAMELELDTDSAAVSGKPVEASLDASDGYILLMDDISTGDVCGSIEEFPPFGSTTPYWRATAGALTVRFEPDKAWGFDSEAFYDGTELGTVTLSATDLLLSPQATASGDITLAELAFTARLAVLDLPAR